MLRRSFSGNRTRASCVSCLFRSRTVSGLLMAALLSVGFVHKLGAADHPARITPSSSQTQRGAETRHVHVAALRTVEHLVQSGRITPSIVQALQEATRQVHADPFVLLAIAWQESRFDPRARSRHSSARGLLQFTNATWLTVIRDFGPRHGLGHMAAAISTGQSGALTVRTRALRKSILALRNDPALEVVMAAERLSQQQDVLEAQLGRPADPADLYILHLLGPSGARDFLTELARQPKRSSIDVVGPAAWINTGLFFRDNRPLTVAAAYTNIKSKLDEQATAHAGLFTVAE